MQKYHESVLNMTGTPADGVSVLVSLFNGGVATIYSDNGVTEASNPLTTNSLGYFEFYAADGRYTLTISGPGIETINITDVLLEDPQDGSAMVIDGGTISDSAISGGTVTDSALSNITIDGVAVAGPDIAKYSRLNDADGSSLVGFIQSGAGAVARTGQDKLRETVSAKDLGAVGDGVANDTVPITNLKARVDALTSAVVNFSGGRYNTTGTFWANNVSPTLMYFDKASVIGLFDGTDSAPNTVDNDPVLWAQKYTKYDNGSDSFAHNVGGLFGSVIIKGSGVTGATDTDGTWIGALGNAVMSGVNQGTSGSPDFDAYGNVIGTAGFARSTGYPGDGHIVCGQWGYAEGPTLDATTYANLPATNWSLVGHEVNIQINHPNLGAQSLLVGKGSSAGGLYKNYRTPGTGVMDWTFGAVFDGTPNDNNYTGTDVSVWSGFYTGLLIDKIKSRGILFGKYFANGSYGIEFPANYSGYAQRPAAAIYVGDNVINMAQYTGASFADNDLWANSGSLFFRGSGVNREIIPNGKASVTQTATGLGVNTTPGFNLDVTAESGGSFGAITGYGGAATFLTRAASGTKTSPTGVTSSMVIGFWGVRGHNSSAMTSGSAGGISATATETWSTTANGVKWVFGVTKAGTTTRIDSFEISDNGDCRVLQAGSGLRVKEGSNAKQGTATLVAGSVTVSNTSVTANSRIFLTSQVDGGTPGFLRVSARSAGVSFTITSSSGTDTSTVAYQIFEPA